MLLPGVARARERARLVDVEKLRAPPKTPPYGLGAKAQALKLSCDASTGVMRLHASTEALSPPTCARLVCKESFALAPRSISFIDPPESPRASYPASPRRPTRASTPLSTVELSPMRGLPQSQPQPLQLVDGFALRQIGDGSYLALPPMPHSSSSMQRRALPQPLRRRHTVAPNTEDRLRALHALESRRRQTARARWEASAEHRVRRRTETRARPALPDISAALTLREPRDADERSRPSEGAREARFVAAHRQGGRATSRGSGRPAFAGHAHADIRRPLRNVPRPALQRTLVSPSSIVRLSDYHYERAGDTAQSRPARTRLGPPRGGSLTYASPRSPPSPVARVPVLQLTSECQRRGAWGVGETHTPSYLSCEKVKNVNHSQFLIT